MKVKSESEVAQSCPTPSDPMDCSPPGSSVHGIFQARVLEWGAIAFSSGFPYFLQFKSEFGNKEFLILFIILQNEASFIKPLSPAETLRARHQFRAFCSSNCLEPLSNLQWSAGRGSLISLPRKNDYFLSLSLLNEDEMQNVSDILLMLTRQPGRLQSMGSRRVGHD